ncbi:MAG: hypothetical protein AABX01_08255 [Candidatus Micrarchaeota archaeon]
MKKAVALLLALASLALLNYYAFVKGTVLFAIPDFFSVLAQVTRGTAQFPTFIQSLGDAFTAIGVIFLSVGTFWVALEIAFSKNKEFTAIISKTPIVFLSVGTGIYFGAQFAHAFADVLLLDFYSLIVDGLLAIAFLEFTLTLLRYLQMKTERFEFSLKLSRL